MSTASWVWLKISKPTAEPVNKNERVSRDSSPSLETIAVCTVHQNQRQPPQSLAALIVGAAPAAGPSPCLAYSTAYVSGLRSLITVFVGRAGGLGPRGNLSEWRSYAVAKVATRCTYVFCALLLCTSLGV